MKSRANRFHMALLAVCVSAALLGAEGAAASGRCCGAAAPAPRPSPAQPQRGSVERRLGGSTSVSVTNSSGTTRVTGTAGDLLRVVARQTQSGSPADVSIEPESGPGGALAVRATTAGAGSEVSLEIEIPRGVPFLSIVTAHGDVSVTDVDGEVRIDCGNGDVRARNVGKTTVLSGSGDTVVEAAAGAVFVEAGSGEVAARGVRGDFLFKSGSGSVTGADVEGAVDGSVTSGDVEMRGVGGTVRAVTISGTITLERVRGAVEAASASGDIVLRDAQGSCSAKTASGTVSFVGSIGAEHQYRLRSMSGDVVMRLCGEVPGFTATLASYSGEIETEFPLAIDRPNFVLNRRVVGRHGDGKVPVQLEAFSGTTKLLGCGQEKQ